MRAEKGGGAAAQASSDRPAHGSLTTDEAADTDELLTTEEVAKLKGISPKAVSRARENGVIRAAKRGPHGVFLFRRADALAFGTHRSNEPENAEGARDARVFAGLREGLTIAEIVEREKVPIRVALQLKAQWVEAHRADQIGIDHRCRSCHTEPANPNISYCTRCAARVHVLRQDQVDAVLGLPPTENSCSCSGCGKSVRVEQADHVCSACRGRVFVGVSGGRLHVKIRSASGEDLTLRTLSIDETEQIVAQLAPAQAASAMLPIEPLVSREQPKESVAERINKMREELAEQMRPKDEDE